MGVPPKPCCLCSVLPYHGILGAMLELVMEEEGVGDEVDMRALRGLEGLPNAVAGLGSSRIDVVVAGAAPT